MERHDELCRPLTPAEVDILGRVFDDLLAEYCIPSEGPDADNLAARVFTLYQSGVRDLELLKKLAIQSGTS
ncbi:MULTISPECIES: hypothetical protein [Sinorhizobium]|uniref:Uncharacterized protein n=1 Tax=Sinorhizobium americanum TaxID=194963 RepID=A0A2S3YVR7_9HYPH|nr:MULTISPECIES: hypothetical protein [Sinorhizobium]PDT39792.1 hypothetical protein CO656_19185 [Sinorhizobium sp. FG01]POH35715.1 hypothetical protein ATY31_00310 [Sinorhizobium americanum]